MSLRREGIEKMFSRNSVLAKGDKMCSWWLTGKSNCAVICSLNRFLYFYVVVSFLFDVNLGLHISHHSYENVYCCVEFWVFIGYWIRMMVILYRCWLLMKRRKPIITPSLFLPLLLILLWLLGKSQFILLCLSGTMYTSPNKTVFVILGVKFL